MSKRADRRHLLEVAYATDDGLAAPASLYGHQSPRWDLAAEALALVGDVARRTVLDVGCGNGRYVRTFTEAGACVVGLDLSAGMLAAVPEPRPALVVVDAVPLPVADASADLVGRRAA